MKRKSNSNSTGPSVGDPCTHCFNAGIKLNRIRSQIRRPSNPSCHDCSIQKRAKRGASRSRSGSSSSEEAHSGPDLIWLCLKCNRRYCGGPDSEEPNAHSPAMPMYNIT